MPIVLASTSRIRREILANAGLVFSSVRPPVEEARLKSVNADLAAPELSRLLATAKAVETSKQQPGRLVIGADQVLHLDGRSYGKPRTPSEARAQLVELKGRSHTLTTAISCAREGVEKWSYSDAAVLRMRKFSDGFLDDYLADVGEDVLTSVGGYKLESRGIQLFESIDGDYFTILGLPILQLLQYLRESGEIGA
jgi:septum formation protein